LFFEHYVDMLDSLAAVGLTAACDFGVLDLGMTATQQAQLASRGVRCVAGTWPVQPPKGQDRPEFVAFAGKPFARDYFPGYEVYLWIDADMWVQNAQFWRDLIEGAVRAGCAVSEESHPGYRTMPMKERVWMHRHLARAFGLAASARLARFPMINNGLFAMHADAPHWALWQARFRQLVERTQRMIAIDQLAMFAMIHLDRPDCVLSDATNNWVCSLGTPHWDPERARFVTPVGESISVLHVTTPARERVFQIPAIGTGRVSERYLHRPGGLIMAALTGQSGSSNAPGAEPSESRDGAPTPRDSASADAPRVPHTSES
jgi:hypothetical protein